MVALEGGMTTIYIKSKNKDGDAHVLIDATNYHKDVFIKVYKKESI